MLSVLHSGTSQLRSSEYCIGDTMPIDSSSRCASAKVIDIGSVVDSNVDHIAL